MESSRDVVEHASQKWAVPQRLSRVNFSREIEMESLNEVKRAPMSAELLDDCSQLRILDRFLVVRCSHRHPLYMISRSNFVSS